MKLENRSFVQRELARQSEYLQAWFPNQCGVGGSAHRLSRKALNLNPSIRDLAKSHFKKHKIVWHQHANHGLSSQICCLNFLLPLATRPEILALLVQSAIGGDRPTMLPVAASKQGAPLFVDFEWLGEKDYLNEWPKRGMPTRGANSTSVDALVRFECNGRQEALLIEWKYTESDAGAIANKAPANPVAGKTYGNGTRRKRYQSIAFAPSGPVKSDLGLSVDDFFFHPFFQLLRQQILAYQLQEDADDPAQRVRLLHITPAANLAVRKIRAGALSTIAKDAGITDAFKLHRRLLADPGDFISQSTESLFAPLIAKAAPDDSWADYLRRRYAFIGDAVTGDLD